MVDELHHVGLSVKDMKKSKEFYTGVMGMEVEYTARHKGEKISRVVGVEEAELDICVVKKGDMRIELIEYTNKDESGDGYKRQDSPGLIHIAFKVSDVEGIYRAIRERGYEFNSPPMVTRENGPKICYFKGPDNVIVELYEKVT